MTRQSRKTLAALIVLVMSASPVCPIAPAPSGTPTASASRMVPPSPQSPEKFADAELDELLAPIALYPDPLLAQVLPAATFVDQIDEAVRKLGGKVDENIIAAAKWDVSVQSVAHYPEVLKMMNDKQDWTTALGQAFVNQSTDVMKSVQRLRAQAQAAGNLASNDKQTVIVEKETIKVVPAQPQVIYVPTYNPQVVYVQDPGPSTGDVVAASIISFGAGLAIGAWLNRDCDWYGYNVYYHGWRGGGWVGASYSHVNIHVHNNIYVNNAYRNVHVNRNINNVNVSNYRREVNRNVAVRQQNVNRNTRYTDSRHVRPQPDRLESARGRPVSQPATARRGASTPRPASSSQLSRASSTSPRARTAGTSNSAFGGYSNRAQIDRQRTRGTQSVQSSHGSRASASRTRARRRP